MKRQLEAAGFPEQNVRQRARSGVANIFPPVSGYGDTLYGATPPAHEWVGHDKLDSARIVPPIFMPDRLERLIELGREPLYKDVELASELGGFRCRLPIYVSAFGSTQTVSLNRGIAIGKQAAQLGIPVVIGENVVPVNGYRANIDAKSSSLVERIRTYVEAADDVSGGVVVQQSTEDADAEVWNQVYSDPSSQALLATGRLGFELKVGQGAKPGLGGMTVVDRRCADRIGNQYVVDELFDVEGDRVLRSSSPGTFTEEILRQQINLMRNNFPKARIWVKLYPGRDVVQAAHVSWGAGADAVTIDGAEGGSGWAPDVFLNQVGLPLAECLKRVGCSSHCLLASGRMWEGGRAVKALALGARGIGLGRAALLAVDENKESGLLRLVESLELEMRMLISAIGKYDITSLSDEDLWFPGNGEDPFATT